MLPLETIRRITGVLRPYVSERRQARIEAALRARTRDIAVVLEDIYSDHNTSAVLRTAEALGLLELHFVAGKSPFTIARKITQGAHKWLDIRDHAAIEAAYEHLKARGYEVWASHFHGRSLSIDRIPEDRPVALVFGNEHDGLSQAAIDGADGHFRVPMHGFVESLNVSVAAAISMYEVHRRRQHASLLSGLSEEDLQRLRAIWYAASVRAAEQLLGRESLPMPTAARPPIIFAEEPDDE